MTINQSIVMDSKGREAILRCIMENKILPYYNALYELAKDIDKCSADCTPEKCLECNELFNKNMEAFGKAFTVYNNFWRNNPNFTEDEKECLEIVFPVFTEVHLPNVDRTYESIRYMSFSKYIDNCVSKQDFIFLVYIGAFAICIPEMQVAFQNVNGKLEGKIFKGIKIEPRQAPLPVTLKA